MTVVDGDKANTLWFDGSPVDETGLFCEVILGGYAKKEDHIEVKGMKNSRIKF